MSNQPRIALFVDKPDWHTRRLQRAFASRGAEIIAVSLGETGFAVGGPGHGLWIPGFDDGLPDAAFVRIIAAGSFEQVTMRLGVLHALRELGVPVHNDARVVERCVDKSMTSFLLHRAGIPTPRTWSIESLDQARALVASEVHPGRPLVLKPLFGSQGRGLRLIDSVDALPPPAETAGVYYLQHYIAGVAPGWRDWRVFVVGGNAVAAMIRHGVQWRTNAAQGARCEGVPATGEIAALAIAATASVGASYAGVDIIQAASGHFLVLEVNSMPAWRALQQVSRIDIADAIAGNLGAALSLPSPAPLGRPRRAAGRR